MQKYVSVNTPLHHLSAGRLTKKLYRRKVAEFPNQEAALAWQAAARQAIHLGREPDMESVEPATTFADIAAAAVPVVFSGNRDQAGVGTNVRKLISWFGDVPADSITQADLIQMADALQADGRSAATINHRLSKFNRIMAWAAERGMVTDPPVYRHKGPGRIRDRVFSVDECQRLIAGLQRHGPVFSQFTTVLLWVGSRYGETAKLTWRDVEGGYAVFRQASTKSGKPRSIPLRGPAKQALEEAWIERGHEPGPFTQLQNHKVYYRRWNDVKADMGLATDEDFVPHSLRHTCMTRLAEDGLSLAQLKAWGGWASYDMVARYEHIESGHDLRKAVDSYAHNLL